MFAGVIKRFSTRVSRAGKQEYTTTDKINKLLNPFAHILTEFAILRSKEPPELLVINLKSDKRFKSSRLPYETLRVYNWSRVNCLVVGTHLAPNPSTRDRVNEKNLKKTEKENKGQKVGIRIRKVHRRTQEHHQKRFFVCYRRGNGLSHFATYKRNTALKFKRNIISFGASL